MGSTIVGVEASFHSTAQLKTQDRPVHPETKRARMRVAQRSQYPLIKEYTLNHNIKAPIIVLGIPKNYRGLNIVV